jgi:hypothetical protein
VVHNICPILLFHTATWPQGQGVPRTQATGIVLKFVLVIIVFGLLGTNAKVP